MSTQAGKQRVVVGLSGGVDSAVSAYLLKQQGFDVIGIFMKNWEDDDNSEYCSSNVDFIDAAAVADVLGIEIEHVNFAAEYKDRVFAEFLRRERGQCFGRAFAAGLEDHAGHDFLAVVGVGYADRSSLEYGRVFQQRFVDFALFLIAIWPDPGNLRAGLIYGRRCKQGAQRFKQGVATRCPESAVAFDADAFAQTAAFKPFQQFRGIARINLCDRSEPAQRQFAIRMLVQGPQHAVTFRASAQLP